MGISDLMINDNTSRQDCYYAVDLSKDPPMDVKECGCYTTEDISESDRCWVTYKTVKTNHYLCSEHMKEYKLSVEKQRQEKLKIREAGKERHGKAKIAAEQEECKIIEILAKLKIPRVRQIVSICMGNGWKCSMHRGYIVITYYGGENVLVGDTVYHNLIFEYKRHGNKYTFNKSQRKRLSRNGMTEITRFKGFYSMGF